MSLNKNILMIDRNEMVDRRIVLEAKTLRALGFQVLLVCVESIDQTLNTHEIDGLSILRLPEYAPLSASLPAQPLAQWIAQIKTGVRIHPTAASLEETPQVEAPTSFFESKPVSRLARIKHTMGVLQTLACSPQQSFECILGASRPRPLKAAAIVAVSSLAFGRGLLQLRKLFRNTELAVYSAAQLTPITDEIQLTLANTDLQRPLAYEKAQVTTADAVIVSGLPSQNLETYFSDQPLDTWETHVLAFARSVSDLDAVHVHDLPALRAGIFIGQVRNLPVIFDAHELYPYQPNMFGKRKAALFDIEARLIHHCAEIVVINTQQAAIMQHDHHYTRFTPLTNATVRPEGFDATKRYDYIRRAVPTIPADHKIMLFMGGINVLRKIDQLFMGMAQARTDVHLALLTWGGEIPFFRDMAEQLGIAERVHFLPPVPWSEVVYWCASADVGVMPYQALDENTRISSPNKMYEFIAAATPMIGSSALVNVQAVVEKEGFGVLRPLREPADYAAVINEIFDESLGGPERFKAALLKHGHRYLWDKEVSGFIAMYQRLFASDVAPLKRTHG